MTAKGQGKNQIARATAKWRGTHWYQAWFVDLMILGLAARMAPALQAEPRKWFTLDA